MCYNIYHIGWPAIRELLDEVDDPVMEQSVRAIITRNTAVKNINTCIVRKSGFDRIVELHLLVDGEKTVREGHLIAHQVEDDIQKHFPNVRSVVVHVEPSYEVVA